MAKMTTDTAKPLMRIDTVDGGARYTLRSDGVILWQWRHEGRLRPATRLTKFKDTVPASEYRAAFGRFAVRRQLPAPVSV